MSSCLTFGRDLPLPGSATRLDYQSIDEARSLLFIAHLGDNSVTVFNLKSSSVVKSIGGIPKPHGILVVPKLNKVYISGTGSNEIYVLDENSLNIINKIPAGTYPDGLDYDPKTNRIFVSDEHGKTVTVIDVLANRVLKTIEMESGVVSVFKVKKDAITKICEGFLAPKAHTVAVDQSTHRVYFPLEDVKGVPVLRVMEPRPGY